MSRTLSFIFLFPLLVACTNNVYETGDARYSYLRTDFVEGKTDHQARITSAITDDGTSLTFTQPLQVNWKLTPNSLCRTMLYYNMYANGTDSTTVEPLSAEMVYTLDPVKVPAKSTIHTDPVNFISAWKSKNGNYLNFCVGIKTSSSGDKNRVQTIGAVLDSVVERSGKPVYYIRFVHDQDSIPQYYTVDTYVSIPTKKMTTGSGVRLSLNTYSGWIVREFTW